MARTKKQTARTWRENVDRVIAMMAPDYDWEAHWESDNCENPEDVFAACCIVGEPEHATDAYACGSYKPKDTAQGLYRMLFLLRPERVDFSDMYKTTLFSFNSADKRFWVQVDLFKYELGLYFYAPKTAIGGRGSGVIAGAPGADNGTHIADPDGAAFFDMVKQAVEREWDVYGGNDFTV